MHAYRNSLKHIRIWGSPVDFIQAETHENVLISQSKWDVGPNYLLEVTVASLSNVI